MTTPEPWECPRCHCLFERAGMDHEPCRAQPGDERCGCRCRNLKGKCRCCDESREWDASMDGQST